MPPLNISGNNPYSVGASSNNEEGIKKQKHLNNPDAGAFFANNSIHNAPAGYVPNLNGVSVWT